MADHRHAARKVFDVAELLENILLRIDLSTLLLAQRVDKTFHATINHSKPLQEALFMRVPTTPSTGSDRLGPLSDHRMKKRIGIHRVSGSYDGICNYSIIFGSPEELEALPMTGSFRRMHIMRPKPGRAAEEWAVSYNRYNLFTMEQYSCQVGMRKFEGVPTVGELLEVAMAGVKKVREQEDAKPGKKQSAKKRIVEGGRKVERLALTRKIISAE